MLVALAAIASLTFVTWLQQRRLDAERDRHRDEVSELFNRIQHPAVFQPTPSQEETIRQGDAAKPEPDEFELAGHVFPMAEGPDGDDPFAFGEND